MKALWLDYQQQPPGWQWPGSALLAISIVLTLALLVHYGALLDEVDRREAEIAQLQRRIERAQIISATDKAGVAPGDALAGKLAMYSAERWDGLLSNLEDAADETMTLLSLTPEKEAITLDGEAKTLADAMAYVERLRGTETLRNPQLSEFAVTKGHPQKPVRFTLQAQWPVTESTP